MDFEITVEEIDKLVNQVNQAIGEVNDVVVRRELEFMRARLADMRVALLELENWRTSICEATSQQTIISIVGRNW
jgi:hypothetical protein